MLLNSLRLAPYFFLIQAILADADVKALCANPKNYGALVCASDTTFALCAPGLEPVIQPVAAGTICKDGGIQAAIVPGSGIVSQAASGQYQVNSQSTAAPSTPALSAPSTSTVTVYSTSYPSTATNLVLVDTSGIPWTTSSASLTSSTPSTFLTSSIPSKLPTPSCVAVSANILKCGIDVGK